MELSAKLPRQRGDRLVLYAETVDEQNAGAACDLKVRDAGRARRSVSGWWDDWLAFEGDLPDLTEPSFVSGRQLTKALETRYPSVKVALRFGPRAAWHSTKERRQAAWDELKMKRPPLHEDTKRLIHALSPECMICGTTARKLEIAHILDWPTIRRLTETHPLFGKDDHDLQRAALLFHDPWNMGVLCRERLHRAGCHDKQEDFRITTEQVRRARGVLDRQPGAERFYGRFLDQSLVEERRRFGLDMNVMARVLALLSEAAKDSDPAPYVLKHGEVRVDRVLGGMWWGEHDCPDRDSDR
ncbi:hypothetical protein [Streptomyces sp. B29(2018)]|uniref:hypothetical protein n=1 Tax=Streptomyces sp. B29(2018) TaxID=2485016 RepID=UPI001F0BE536|nr:hypothetical protein [Streptomyces sp. B29(2018)]